MPLHRYALPLLLLAGLATGLQAQPALQGDDVTVPFDAEQTRFQVFSVTDGLSENTVITCRL